MRIISDFDPNFCCMSLDECYVDLTEYTLDVFCDRNPDFDRNAIKGVTQLPNEVWDFAAQVVANIRQRIHKETQLTASAGIACNSMIAKVCSDYNKPNGQHMVRGNREEIEDFLQKTEVRKICGIGPVRAQFLTALGIKTCKDLWNKRAIVRFAFSNFNFEYYLKVGLGIGSTIILRDDEPKKSISCERTIKVVSDFHKLAHYLKDMSEEVSEELKQNNQICKTVTVKLKKWTFELSVRCQTLPYFTSDSETILNLAKSILSTQLSNTPIEVRKYRLIGLRVSNLKLNNDKESVSSSQMTLSQIYNGLTKRNDINHENTEEVKEEVPKQDQKEEHNKEETSECYRSFYDTDLYECSVCSEKFEHKNLFESHENDCIGQMLSERSEQMADSADLALDEPIDDQLTNKFVCPICSIQITTKDNDQLNQHIDMCLNKDKCTELTKVTSTGSQSTSNLKSVKRVCSETKVKERSSQRPGHRLKRTKAQTSSSKSQKTLDFFFNSQ